MLITSHVILTCRHPRSEDSRTSTLMLSSFMSSWLSLFTAKSGMKTLPDGINPTRRLNLQNGWDMHWTTLASFSEVWMGCDASGSISDDVRSLWKERAVGWISGTMFMVCEIHFLLSWGMVVDGWLWMLSRYAIHYYDWANTVESRIEDLHLNNMTPRQLFVFQPSEDTKVTIVREGKFPLVGVWSVGGKPAPQRMVKG